MKNEVRRAIIFTDLDGTLLDHHSYSFTPAQQALDRIKKHHIPLVLCSSKTAAEMRDLQTRLGIRNVFICENGAGIISPGNAQVSSLPTYPAIIDELNRLSAHYDFTGFSTMSVAQLVQLTGLDDALARQAAQRQFSEPLLWRDSEDNKQRFLQDLKNAGFIAQQGGRFLTVTHRDSLNKGDAMQYVMANYYNGDNAEYDVIALGDSPNDVPMLERADIAVVIPPVNRPAMALSHQTKVITASAPGPKGWQQAMDELLPHYIPYGDSE